MIWMAEWWKSLPQNRMYIKKKLKRIKGNEDSLRDLWGNIKCIHFCLSGKLLISSSNLKENVTG